MLEAKEGKGQERIKVSGAEIAHNLPRLIGVSRLSLRMVQPSRRKVSFNPKRPEKVNIPYHPRIDFGLAREEPHSEQRGLRPSSVSLAILVDWDGGEWDERRPEQESL